MNAMLAVIVMVVVFAALGAIGWWILASFTGFDG